MAMAPLHPSREEIAWERFQLTAEFLVAVLAFKRTGLSEYLARMEVKKFFTAARRY